MFIGCKQEGYRGLVLILVCCVGILSIMDIKLGHFRDTVCVDGM